MRFTDHFVRDFLDATARVIIGESEMEVRFQKRAHRTLLIAAGLDQTSESMPGLGNKRLRLTFG